MTNSFSLLHLIRGGLSLMLAFGCTGAWAADSSSCLKSLPATLGELHAQKPKPKVDTSTEQLFYEMAQSDGTGMAQIPIGSIVARKYCEQAQNLQPPENDQQTG